MEVVEFGAKGTPWVSDTQSSLAETTPVSLRICCRVFATATEFFRGCQKGARENFRPTSEFGGGIFEDFATRNGGDCVATDDAWSAGKPANHTNDHNRSCCGCVAEIGSLCFFMSGGVKLEWQTVSSQVAIDGQGDTSFGLVGPFKWPSELWAEE
jgi:hypothetical protein